MLALELSCAAIVAVYVGARRDAIPQLVLLAVAGFLGEDSVIRAYGFYFYNPRWHLFLDRVPLMIVVIWPIVIHSAWSEASHRTARAMSAGSTIRPSGSPAATATSRTTAASAARSTPRPVTRPRSTSRT